MLLLKHWNIKFLTTPRNLKLGKFGCWSGIWRISQSVFGTISTVLLCLEIHTKVGFCLFLITSLNIFICKKLPNLDMFVFLQVTKEELAKLVQGFEKQDILTSSGVTLAGNRYIYLSGTDKVIRAKLGKVGVHCMKTTQGKFVFSLFSALCWQ